MQNIHVDMSIKGQYGALRRISFDTVPFKMTGSKVSDRDTVV